MRGSGGAGREDSIDPALDAILPLRRAHPELRDLRDLQDVCLLLDMAEQREDRGAEGVYRIEHLFFEDPEGLRVVWPACGVVCEDGGGCLEDVGVARAEKVGVGCEEVGDGRCVLGEGVDV